MPWVIKTPLGYIGWNKDANMYTGDRPFEEALVREECPHTSTYAGEKAVEI